MKNSGTLVCVVTSVKMTYRALGQPSLWSQEMNEEMFVSLTYLANQHNVNDLKIKLLHSTLYALEFLHHIFVFLKFGWKIRL